MSLDLHPEVERQVVAAARAAGITPSDYVARLLVAADMPAADPVAHVRGVLRDWQQRDRTPSAPPVPNDGALTPSEALFRQWEREDAGLTEESRRTEEERWQQFQDDINAERAAAGMRPIF